MLNAGSPQPFAVGTSDSYTIHGFYWRHAESADTRPVVIINPATSVRCRYYFRFANFLFQNGFDVVAYDYRGIGESRPSMLRNFDACWLDWGALDFEAVLLHTASSFADQPIHVVAHSIGGFVLGLAPSNHLVQRIFTMGAQYAYRGDYAAHKKLRLIAKWHVAMPLLTLLFGYFPGKKLGWLEDTPGGVVRDWIFSRARFEDTWRGRASARYADKRVLVDQFSEVTAPILAVSMTDDEFGTVPAVERLLNYFSSSARSHLRISPESISEAAIGHFDFFNSRLEQKLWHIPLDWLKFGKVSTAWPGHLIAPASERL
ncbi:alpha/beta fold hydrolase [Bradyrhizobium sp. dw_411]|uniref:alpha/beta hydrolase family protein n=1 Tax=Bradyrhizobium sp. dw_411 TaxID=2720082 RepID=UPI001BD06730|nr:alpha/beta fold hydrolase [Bradyrhizobium sp. dw_411]